MLSMRKANRGLPRFWELEHRGNADLLHPETTEAYVRMFTLSARAMRSDLERRVNCCDIEELHFDEQLVVDFIALVRELDAISERTEVFLMPVNHDWVHRSPEALERQRAVLSRIERETGVRISDFQTEPPFEASLFSDTTHLLLTTGRPRFSRFLADHYSMKRSQRLTMTSQYN